MLVQVRAALRRLYLRRALTGWYTRVLLLQQERIKLRSAAQVGARGVGGGRRSTLGLGCSAG